MFKKRNGTNKNNIRKRSVDENENDDNDMEQIIDIKLQQSLRNKCSGTSLEDLKIKSSSSSKSSKLDITVETVLGAQFSVQSDSVHQTGVSHDKIMEKYIEEKLGLNDKPRYFVCCVKCLDR